MGLKGSALAAVGRARDCRDAVHKLGAEDDVGVAEHALLERDHNELGVGEVRLDHAPNVLGVAQVQSSIHLQHMIVSKDLRNESACQRYAPNVLDVALPPLQGSIHLPRQPSQGFGCKQNDLREHTL